MDDMTNLLGEMLAKYKAASADAETWKRIAVDLIAVEEGWDAYPTDEEHEALWSAYRKRYLGHEE